MVSVEFKKVIGEELSKVADSWEMRDITKNNGIKLSVVVIRKEGETIAPTIYLEDFERRYEKGESIESIIRRIVALSEEEPEFNQSDIMEVFTNFDKVKKNIVFELVSAKKNAELLEGVPHVEELGDLAVIFRVQIYASFKGGAATILITNEHAKMWGVTASDLYREAKENSKRLRPAKVETMGAMLTALMGEEGFANEGFVPDMPGMYVVTNEVAVSGAAVILYEGVLKELADKLDDDLVILPSSIHECIIVPKSLGDIEELTALVQLVNGNEVGESDILSDHAYIYDRKQDKVVA